LGEETETIRCDCGPGGGLPDASRCVAFGAARLRAADFTRVAKDFRFGNGC
jgi:hypothetical protein